MDQALPLTLEHTQATLRVIFFTSVRRSGQAGPATPPQALAMEGSCCQSSGMKHIAILLALAGLSAGVQTWLVLRAEVPSLDAVRLARIAQAVQDEGCGPALRHQREQPLFPVWVAVVHRGLTAAAGESPSSWAHAVQLAAAAPLVLCVVPVYLIALRLFGAGAAVAASVLFLVLPEVARLGADGLSDSTHLLFGAVAVWAVVEGLARDEQRVGWAWLVWFIVAGLATGLAALARAEVLIVPAALLLTLVVRQLRSRGHGLWRSLSAVGVFALASVLSVAPFLVAVRCSSPREAAARLLGHYDAERYATSAAGTAAASCPRWHLPTGRPMSFAVKDPTTSLRRRGVLTAAVSLAHRLVDAFGYWVAGLAVFGLWRLRGRSLPTAGMFLVVLLLLYSAAALRFAAIEGYLGSRHMVLPVAAGIGAAGWGAVELGQLATCTPRVRVGFLALSKRPRVGTAMHRLAAGAPLGLAVAGCLAAQAGPLHASRAPHRAAGEWLGLAAPVGTLVVDTRGWTGLYSGRTTIPYEDSPAVLADPRTGFLVLEPAELRHASRRSQTLNTLLETAAVPAAAFPASGTLPEGWQPVAVYRWDAAKFRSWSAAQAADVRPQENRYARDHSGTDPHGGRSL